MRVGINGMGRIGRLALRAAMGGVWRAPDDPRGLDVLLVQGSIDTELKHDPDAAGEVLAEYDGLTRAALADGRSPDLVVWPETMWRWGLLEIDPDEVLPESVVGPTLAAAGLCPAQAWPMPTICAPCPGQRKTNPLLMPCSFRITCSRRTMPRSRRRRRRPARWASRPRSARPRSARRGRSGCSPHWCSRSGRC